MALKEKEEERKKIEMEAERAIKEEEKKEENKKNEGKKGDNDDLKNGDGIYDEEAEFQKLMKGSKTAGGKGADKNDYLSGYDEYFKAEGFGINKGNSHKYGGYHSKAMMHHNHLNTIEEDKFET